MTSTSCLRLIVSLAVTATNWQSNAASAALGEWRSKLVQSANGQFVLAMIAPKGLAIENNSRDTAIRNRYPQSGLYRRGRPPTLQWSIEHSWTEDAFVANDGRHVVLADIDWTDSYSNNGDLLHFVQEGKLLARYNSYSLINSLSIKSLCCRMLDRPAYDCLNIRFDFDAATYAFQTNHGESFTFSLATGRPIDHWSPWPYYLAAALVAGPALAFGIRRLPSRAPSVRGDEVARPYRFTLLSLFEVVTFACLALAAWRLNTAMSYVFVVVAAIGAVIARHRSRAATAPAIGAATAVYGFTLGVIVLASIVDLYVLLAGFVDNDWPNFRLIAIPMLLIASCRLAGALTARQLTKGGNRQ